MCREETKAEKQKGWRKRRRNRVKEEKGMWRREIRGWKARQVKVKDGGENIYRSGEKANS